MRSIGDVNSGASGCAGRALVALKQRSPSPADPAKAASGSRPSGDDPSREAIGIWVHFTQILVEPGRRPCAINYFRALHTAFKLAIIPALYF
jgi:hypothetical protein